MQFSHLELEQALRQFESYPDRAAAAAIAGVTPQTILTWELKGKLRVFRVKGSVRVDPQSLAALLKKRSA